MNASEFLLRVTAIVFAVLPPFLLGLAGGLWCWRVSTSILTGLVIGLLATAMPVISQSQDPMVLWGEVAPRLLLFFVIPAVLGGYAGPKARSRSLRRYPVGLTVAFLLFGVLVYMLLLPPWSAARSIALQTMCTNNLKKIGVALSKYAETHDGHLPPEDGAKGLDHLLREGFLDKTEDATVFLCPWDDTRHAAHPGEPLTEDTVSYVYKGSLWQSAGPASAIPICWDKIENHRSIGLNVLFKDGHVEWMRFKEWEKIRPKT
jgi:hypothetical protein